MSADTTSYDRDFNDKEALDRCRDDVKTAITYVLGRVEAAAELGLAEQTKHRLTIAQLRGLPLRCCTASTTSAGWRTTASLGRPSRVPYLPDILRNENRPTKPRGNGRHNDCKTGAAVRRIEVTKESEANSALRGSPGPSKFSAFHNHRYNSLDRNGDLDRPLQPATPGGPGPSVEVTVIPS